MIYTVTFNPSLDYIVATDSLILGKVNRTVSELILSGGKGVNVSIVLNNLNVKNTALGFIAGFTGKEIENGLKKLGCCCDFITIEKGFSRINIKIKAKEETELNGMGPEISQKELNQLFEKLDCLQSQDILILAGSVPNSLPQNIYEKIMERLQNKNIKIIVDATKDLLINVMKYQPFLVKPNTHELGELFHTTLNTEEDIIFYGKKLQQMANGNVNVLVSRAGEGAILIGTDDNIYKSPAPKGTLINSVGAGDSMVAGFIAGYLKNHSLEEAFYMGVATGSASAFSKYLATKEEVEAVLSQLKQM
ncbi:MAG TPA: 1-phosphofructokinase [Candidatus Coprocola pullicola]|mgnify:FL=1|nr:1-phosphofructokinase [Candidatus Coprocola pullicola]